MHISSNASIITLPISKSDYNNNNYKTIIYKYIYIYIYIYIYLYIFSMGYMAQWDNLKLINQRSRVRLQSVLVFLLCLSRT